MHRPFSANDIRITRIYDAPVALVWDAWTDLAQVVQWWGPRGFTLTTHSKDLRPGGSWVYTMHGPDGTDWPNFTRYHEVEPRALLVYDHGASAEDARPMFRVTAIFRDLGDKTELDMRMTLPTAEEAQRTRAFIKTVGGNSTWDRLAEFLEKERSSSEIFVISRSFEAPLTTVFDMWTTPAHLAAWLPPAGFTMAFQRADIRAGGDAAFSMSNGDFVMYARHEYVQVHRPDRLEYTQTFTDEQGNESRQPGEPNWPVTTRVWVSFAEEGELQTRVTVRFDIDGAATPAEIAAFTAERAGMTLGWNGSFNALDDLLAGGESGTQGSR
ncbi:MAG: SRPBCC domain-containing protein [Gemmatimonadaceae bacterium]|nr:SRPBCC domain-containing protein [Gemmatimonadaceae bacterium]